MKNVAQITLPAFLILALFSSGCASTRAYFINRGRDAADIFTLGVEKGVMGVSGQAGPLSTGLMLTAGDRHRGAYGLMGGEFGPYETEEFQAVFVGIKHMKVKSERDKGYTLMQVFFIPSPQEGGMIKTKEKNGMGDVQVRAGIWCGMVAGFDVIELADFALGLFGVDILRDDLEKGESSSATTDEN